VEKFDPIDIEFLINSAEVKANAKGVKDDITGVGKTAEDTAARVKKQVGSIYRAGDKELNAQAATVGRVKSQYNGLGNSINQITRELPAFTFSAQTGFLALSNNIPILADEIGRLSTKNKELNASGQKTTSVFKQVVGGLLSWGTALSLGVTILTVYGAQIVSFIGDLFKGKTALDEHKASVEALNKAYESTSYKKTIQDLIELRSSIKLAKEGLIDKKVALKQYNESLGKVYKSTEDLNEAERITIEKAPAYIESMLFKAAATLAASDAAKQLAENALKQFETEEELAKKTKEEAEARLVKPSSAGAAQGQFTNLGANTAAFNQKVLKGELEELEKDAEDIQDQGAKIVNNLNQRAAEIAKAAGLDIFGDSPTGKEGNGKREVSQRKNLLEKIANLDREFARKQLESDAEEVAALKEKFDKARRLVDEFNKDPKNAKVNIDTTALDTIEKQAVTDLTYTQDTRKLKDELEVQKAFFAEFEEYKKTFGIEKARERYSVELGEFESYAALLKAKIEENKDAFEAVAYGTGNVGQGKRVDLLSGAANDQKQQEQKQYDELLEQLVGYEDQRKNIIEKYQREREQLVKNGDQAQIAELDKQLRENLNKIDDGFVKDTEAYKDLIRGVVGLSTTAAKGVVTNARAMLDALRRAGKISVELYRDIEQKIAKLEQDVAQNSGSKLQGVSDQIGQIAGAFQNLGDSVSAYDEGLGDTISTFGELAAVAADAAGAAADFMSGNIVGGITKTISAISGVLRIGAKSRESEKNAKQEIVEINQRIEDGERRLNELLRDRNILRAKEVELTLDGIAAQREALRLARDDNSTDQRGLLQELQQGEFISGSKTEKYGGFLGIGRKTRVVNEYSELMGLTFDQIEKLYEESRLEGRTEELFEQLRRLKEEGQDINGLLKDLEDQSNQVFTATTAESIGDTIIEGLRQGKRGVEEFGSDMEKIIQSAILNSIKYNTLEQPLQELYQQFADFAESGNELTDAEANSIRAQYEAQVQKAINQYDQLSGILDQSLLQENTGSGTGLSGAIRRELTEETGSELAGLQRGTFDVTKRLLQVNEKHLEIAQQSTAHTQQLVQSSFLIEQNTAATVIQLAYAVTELKNITKNTKPSQSSRDLGKGGP